MDTTPIKGADLQSAINTSVAGARKSEAKFVKAAETVVNNFAEAGNKLTERFEGARESSQEISADAVATTNEVSDDPTQGIVDMKIAQRAYEASLKTFKVADEMQQTLLDIKA